MKIWKPKWVINNENDHYKKFFDVKQDWIDIKMKKTLMKIMCEARLSKFPLLGRRATSSACSPREMNRIITH